MLTSVLKNFYCGYGRKLAKIFPGKFPGKGSPVDIQLICPGLMFLFDSSIPLNKNSHWKGGQLKPTWNWTWQGTWEATRRTSGCISSRWKTKENACCSMGWGDKRHDDKRHGDSRHRDGWVSQCPLCLSLLVRGIPGGKTNGKIWRK